MNLLNVSLGLKNTLVSINVFNISFGRSKEKNKKNIENEVVLVEEKNKYKNLKTTLLGSKTDVIGEINSEINAYFFIEKRKDASAWNLVAPIIHVIETNIIYQFELGYFALEGSGGGLINTKDIIFELKKLTSKGIKVNFIPRVIENELIHAFEYADSDVTLEILIEKSINLLNYRKDSFDWIYKQYCEIIKN